MSGQIADSRNTGRDRGCGIRPPAYLPDPGSATAPPARPVRNRRTAAALAAGLALAVVTLCAVSTSARAQEAYVSNLAQSHIAGELSVSRRWSQAIGFTTGSRSGGYTLSHLETIITDFSGDGLLVSLYDEAAGGGPGTRQFDFPNPDEFTANALAAFMAPADTTLAADTRYFVVCVETGEGSAFVAATPQTSEDGGASPGWSIDDRRYYMRNDNDDGWKPAADAGVPRFALNPPGATADTTPPALATATANGTSLVLTYDEALDEDSVPAAAAYAVNVDGGGATAPASVAVGGSAVTLTLGTAIIGGQTVTVSYTVPSTDPVQDVPGNDAAALTGRPVTNLSNTPATGKPQISGAAQVGQTLTAKQGAIADADGLPDTFPDDYDFQWVRVDGANETDIGSDDTDYTVVAADEGATIKVRVNFTDGAGKVEVVESDATAAVSAKPESCATDRAGADWCTIMTVGVAVGAARLSGYSRIVPFGALEDTAIDYGGQSHTIAWLATQVFDDETIGDRFVLALYNATSFLPRGLVLNVGGTQFTLDADSESHNVGEYVWNTPNAPTWLPGLKVTVSLALANSPAGGTPTIAGTAEVGQTLSASTGGITDTDGRTRADGGEPGYAYTYQWVRVNDGTDTDIAGATNRTYRLVAADVGTKIKVKVGFTDDNGNAEEVESDPWPDTGTVLSEPSNRISLCGAEVGPAVGIVIGAHVDVCWETGDAIPAGDDVAMEWRLKSFWGMDNPEPWDQWSEFARGNAFEACAPGSTTCVKFRVGRFSRGFPFTLQARIRRGGADLSPPLSATLEAAMPNADTTALVPQLSAPVDETTGRDIDTVTGPFVLELTFTEPVGNGFLGALSTEAVRDLDAGDFEATNATVDAVEIWGGGAYKVSVTPTEPGQPVTVELPAGTVRGVGEGITAAGANNFTRDNVASNRVSTASALPLPALSVLDATVEEGEDVSLLFEVKLDRKASETVTVDYATSDGSATEGQDYTGTSGKLTFDPLQTAHVVSVTVLDDDISEESETLKFTLSNPSGAHLAVAEATGTITNSDPIPRAWIARFGRTVADQVLDAVDERLRAARSARAARAEVTLGGRRIGFGSAYGQESGDGEGTVAPAPGPASPLVATAPDPAWLGATAQPDAEGTARLKTLASWLNGAAPEDGLRQTGSRTMTGREVLAGSFFSLAAETDGDGVAALWGRMVHSGFAGREGTLDLDGDVTTGLLGADYARERWTAGLVVSRSIGEGGFRGASSGDIEATMTTVAPWAGYAVSDRMSVWGAGGRGTGDLSVKPAVGAALETELQMTLAAAGARARLAGGDGPRLDAVTDARWVRTTSARVTSSAGNLAPATARVTRLRLGLDGSWPLALGGGVPRETTSGEGAPGQGATLTPRLGLGLRHDGGDAETGYGVDITGGVDLAAPARGLAVSLDGRGVLTHEAAGLRDRAIAGTLSWSPRPLGRGPKLTLKQSFGMGASGSSDALLARETLEGFAAGDDRDGRRLEAQLGYGLAMFGGRFLGTPEIGLGLSETGRDYSLGWRLISAGAGRESLELSLEARRHESADDTTDPEHAAGFRLTVRF